MKLLGQFLVMLLVFVGSWLLLAQVDLMGAMKIENREESLEQKLGKRIEKEILRSEEILEDTLVYRHLDEMLIKICVANDLDREDYSLTILNSSTINAFAIPGNSMMFYSGLIQDSESAEEVAGVIAHELAHITERHAMRGLIRELGIALLTAAAGGGSMTEIMHILTSSAFSRDFETEADDKAVEYLQNAKIDPEGLANFLYRIAIEAGTDNELLKLVSTHPDGEARAVRIGEMMDQDITHEPLCSEEEWQNMQDHLRITY